MDSSGSGKWVLVTGASAGIGEAFAKRFAQERWNVVLVARSIEKLNLLAETLKKEFSINALTIKADLSAPDSCEAVYKQITSKGIVIEGLINNAGFGAVGSFLAIERKRQLEMIDLNVRALLDLTHLFLPGMLERQNGLIINVSSTASFQAIPYFITYSATKAFVTLFTEGLWAEYRKQGIRVMNLCPGSTKTNFGVVAGKKEMVSDWRPNQTAERVVDDAFKAIKKNQPTIVTNFFDNTFRFFERLLPRKWVLLATQRVAERMGYRQ